MAPLQNRSASVVSQRRRLDPQSTAPQSTTEPGSAIELSRIELSWAPSRSMLLNWIELSWVPLTEMLLSWIELRRIDESWMLLSWIELSWSEPIGLDDVDAGLERRHHLRQRARVGRCPGPRS